MRKSKKIFAVIMLGAMIFSLSGCNVKKNRYDISGYIGGVLSNSYKGSDVAEGVGQDYYQTTAENAAIRFLNRYQLNADDTQKAALTEVFKTAYSNSKYTVADETEAAYGFDVKVSYEVQTTFKNIQTDIQKRRDDAIKSESATQVGAKYIDGIIELCKNTVQTPTYDGNGDITFDIKLDENSDLSVNIKLFDTLDEVILPLE